MFDLAPQDDAGGAHGDVASEREGDVLEYLAIWEGNHRTLIYGIIALSLWVSAWLIYLKSDIRNYFRRRAPHRWGVDMAAKTVTSGPKPVQ
jgi:hypothetical protein